MRLFLGLMLISFNLFAATGWNDLETDTEYKLTQSFALRQLAFGDELNVMSGEKLILREITGLDMIKVSLFIFDYKNCPGTEMKTDMEIIPVKGTSPVVEVGAQLEKNCKLSIFIENKDLMSLSFFE